MTLGLRSDDPVTHMAPFSMDLVLSSHKIKSKSTVY